MKYSMKPEHCEISLGQVGYFALVFLNYRLIAQNTKNDVPVNIFFTQLTYLNEC